MAARGFTRLGQADRIASRRGHRDLEPLSNFRHGHTAVLGNEAENGAMAFVGQHGDGARLENLGAPGNSAEHNRSRRASSLTPREVFLPR